MIKYAGTTKEGIPIGISLSDYKVYELYSSLKPYRIRRFFRGNITQFKSAIVEIIREQIYDKQIILLNFINNAAYITPKLHQLDVFKKRYKNKFLKYRPYGNVSEFEEKTGYKFSIFFSELVYKEIEENNHQLVNLFKLDENSKIS